MVWRRGFDASAVTLPERQNVSQKTSVASVSGFHEQNQSGHDGQGEQD